MAHTLHTHHPVMCLATQQSNLSDQFTFLILHNYKKKILEHTIPVMHINNMGLIDINLHSIHSFLQTFLPYSYLWVRNQAANWHS